MRGRKQFPIINKRATGNAPITLPSVYNLEQDKLFFMHQSAVNFKCNYTDLVLILLKTTFKTKLKQNISDDQN